MLYKEKGIVPLNKLAEIQSLHLYQKYDKEGMDNLSQKCF